MTHCKWLALLVILAIAVTTSNAEDKERVKVTGIKRIWGDTDKKVSFLEGDLLIVQKEVQIRTSYAEVDQDKKEAWFSKKVILTKEELTIEGQRLNMKFQKKQGVFEEDVLLRREEVKDKKGKVKKEAFTMNCSRLEFDTKKENFVATGDVLLDHKEFKGRCQKVTYDNDKQIMVMTGNPVLDRDNGESLRGGVVRIDLENKQFEVTEGAEVEFTVDDDDEETGDEQTENGQVNENEVELELSKDESPIKK